MQDMAGTAAAAAVDGDDARSNLEGHSIANSKRRRRVPPASLVEYGQSKEYCSVTDLVSPVWCEYAFQYNLLGLSHLPISQRPKQIKTPQGNIVKVNIEIAQQRDKVLTAGRQVHKRLEKEIHPIRIYVETTTREDAWGLRLLQLITGLSVLMDSGCCRELPVFGFIEGRLVIGVIDEVRIHHKNDSTETAKKKWSSQEEWKKKSTQQKKFTNDSSQKTLAAFLPGVEIVTKETSSERTGVFGFVLEDAKTRLSMSMPEEKDQTQSKLQCMIYRRLLDGLIVGLSNRLDGVTVDENATPVTEEVLLLSLGLDKDVQLSDEFMRDATELCNGFNLSLQANQDEKEKWTCNLHHLFGLLADTLSHLVDMAQVGATNKQDFSVIQNELRLTYRQRGGRWSKRSRNERRKQPSRRASAGEQGNGNVWTMLQGQRSIEDLDEEAQVELALQISLGDTNNQEEEEKLEDHTIALSSPQKSKTRDTIIGTVRFQHDPRQLQEHLIDIMGMWRGERPLRGVTVEQTWRCDHCEYQADCEWRQIKAQESLKLAIDKRQQEEDRVMWSQVDDIPDDMEW